MCRLKAPNPSSFSLFVFLTNEFILALATLANCTRCVRKVVLMGRPSCGVRTVWTFENTASVAGHWLELQYKWQVLSETQNAHTACAVGD